MELDAWLKVVIICLFGAMSPGPSLFIVMHHSTNNGRLSGVLVSIGHGIGIAIYAIIVILGLSFITVYLPDLNVYLSIFGSLFLFYIGFMQLIKTYKDYSISVRIKLNKKLQYFIQGFLVSIINPKITIFFLDFSVNS